MSTPASAQGGADAAPSMVLLIGGKARAVGLLLKERLAEKTDGEEGLPELAFLFMDTESPPESWGTATLEASEVAYAAVPPKQWVAESFTQQPGLWRWFPKGVSAIPDSGSGTGGSRLLGRAAFAANAEAIGKSLKAAVRRLARPSPPAEETPTVQPGAAKRGCKVYVVASLAEGASGMLLDVVCLARDIVATVAGEPLRMTGLFLIPPAGGSQRERARAYGALMEVNHHLYPDTSFRPLHGAAASESGAFPLDNCLLLVDNQEGVVSAADFLHACLFPEFTDRVKAASQACSAPPTVAGARADPRSFSTLGVSRLRLAREKIVATAAARITHDFLESWLAPTPLAAARLSARVEPYVDKAGLPMYSLIEALQRDPSDSQESLRARIHAWTVKLTEAVTTKPGSSAYLVGLIDHEVREMDKLFQHGEGGRYVAAVAARSRSELARQKAQLRKALSECACEVRSGWPFTCRFLTALAEQISQLSVATTQEMETLREEIGIAREARQAKLQRIREAARGLGPEMLKRKRVGALGEEFAVACSEYFGTALSLLCAEGASALYAQLSQWVREFLAANSETEKALQEMMQASLQRSQVPLAASEAEELIMPSPSDLRRLCARELQPGGKAEEVASRLFGDGAVFATPPGTELARAIVKRLVEESRGLAQLLPVADLVGRMLEIPDVEQRSRLLRILYDSAAPGVTVDEATTGVCETPEVCFLAGWLSDPQGWDRSQELSELLPEDLPREIIHVPCRDSLCLVRLRTGLPLRCMAEVTSCREDYEQITRSPTIELMTYPHSAADEVWKPLAQPSAEAVEDVEKVLSLAVAFEEVELREDTELGPQQLWFVARERRLGHTVEQAVGTLCDRTEILATLRERVRAREAEVGFDNLPKLLKERETALDWLPAEERLTYLAALDRYVHETQALADRELTGWLEAVEEALLETGVATAEDLKALPPAFRRYTLAKFASGAGGVEGELLPDPPAFRAHSAEALKHFRGMWEEWVSQLSSPGALLDPKDARLVQCVAEATGLIRRGSRFNDHFVLHTVEAKSFGRRLPSVFPLILPRTANLGREEWDGLRALVEEGEGTPRFGVVLAAHNVEAVKEEMDQRMRRRYGYDFIVFGERHLARMFLSAQPSESLRHAVLGQIDLTVISPYVTEGPVPEGMFFGREIEIRDIVTKIEDSSLALVGARRMGKTSVMLRSLKALEAKGLSPVFIECETLRTHHDLLRRLCRNCRVGNQSLWEGPPSHFDDLVDLLRSGTGADRLVFVFDEVDALLETDRESDNVLFSVFRSQSQEGSCRFLLCGEAWLFSGLHDAQSPLFNFCKEILVGRLERDNVEELILQPMRQLDIDLLQPQEMVDQVMEITSGHPNLVQWICGALIETINRESTRTLTLEHLGRVAAMPAFLDRYMETVWGSSNVLEKLVTLIIEDGEERVSLEQLHNRLVGLGLPTDLRTLNVALRNLTMRSLLEPVGAGYRFAIKSFPAIARRRQPASATIGLLIEEVLSRR